MDFLLISSFEPDKNSKNIKRNFLNHDFQKNACGKYFLIKNLIDFFWIGILLYYNIFKFVFLK